MLVRILVASTVFLASEYLAFARRGIIALFPYMTIPSISALPTPVSSPTIPYSQAFQSPNDPIPLLDLYRLPHRPDPFAAHAIFIARSFSLPEILPRAFYDLARSPSLAPNASIQASQKSDAEMNRDIQQLSHIDHFVAVGVQKLLLAAWDRCHQLLQVDRCSEQCTLQRHQAPGIASSAKHKFPVDPVIGMNYLLLEVDWASQGYCHDAQRVVRDRLESERERIWEAVRAQVAPTMGHR